MRERDLIQLGRILAPAVMFSAMAISGMFRRRRNNTLIMEALLSANRRELYLAGLLDKHEVEIDEFDLIALNNL